MFRLVHKERGVGVVCAVNKGKIQILTDGGPCAARKKNCKVGCGSCSALKSERRFYAAVKNHGDYVVGDKVNFCRFVPEPNLVSFLVFGTPILFAVASMLCWLLAAPQKIESPAAVVSAAAAFFCGFFVLMIVDALFKRRYPAAVTKERRNEP